MTPLFNTVQLLMDCASEPNEAFTLRVAKAFRDAYARVFQRHKRIYVQRVMHEQLMSYAAIAKFLGYRTRSAINAIKNGSISHEKFDMLQETLGANVRWPRAQIRRSLAMIAAISYVRTQEMNQRVRESLDRESLEILTQALSDDKTLGRLQDDGDEAGWIEAVVRRVRERLPLKRKLDASILRALIAEWGPAYLRTQYALYGFVRSRTKSTHGSSTSADAHARSKRRRAGD
jgi:hypothetical protein